MQSTHGNTLAFLLALATDFPHNSQTMYTQQNSPRKSKCSRSVSKQKSQLDRLRHGRSRITNGGDVLPYVDGRTTLARRYRDIASQLATDQGGADRLSEARLQLIRRFAACACIAEQLEAALARGEQIDIGEHSQLCSSLVRLVSRLGIDRVARNATPSLQDYLETANGKSDNVTLEEGDMEDVP